MNAKPVTSALTIFFVMSYLLCIGVGFFIPHNYGMHHLLESVLPGFEWISLGSFFVGLVGTAFWGLYIGLGFTFIYNALNK